MHIARLQHFLRSLGHRPTKQSDLQSLPKGIITPKTIGKGNTGPYDRGFQQHLIDYGILPHDYEFPDGRLPPEPENKDDILRALAQPRASLAPRSARMKERDITTSVVPIIEGNVGDRNPDIYYGARPEQLHPQLRNALRGCVVPSTQSDLPVAPNFSVEIKGKDGLLLRNPFRLPYDNEAHTLGCTYVDGQLKIFACHAIQPPMPSGQTSFVMTQLRAFALSNDVDTFRQGAAAYRNGRDWAMKQRNDAIGQVNKRVSWDEVITFCPAYMLLRLKRFWSTAVSRLRRRD
ncbi:hypothetical protein V8C42DRAFT_356486 [Trichoderma barbatum]